MLLLRPQPRNGQSKHGSFGASATDRLSVEGPNEGVSISIFCCCDGRFRFDDGVDSTNLEGVSSTFSVGVVSHTSIGNFCRNLKEIMITDVSVCFGHFDGLCFGDAARAMWIWRVLEGGTIGDVKNGIPQRQRPLLNEGAGVWYFVRRLRVCW